MKISYDIDIDDWTCFQRYHNSASPTYNRMRTYSRLMFPLAALLFVFSHYLSHGFDPVRVGLFAVMSVAWFLLYPRWVDRRVIRRSHQFLREGNHDSMFGHREMELLPDNLHITSASGETTYRASAITKVVETADALLLYVSFVQALILPKRKLSPQVFQQASTFAQQHYAHQAA